MKVHLKVKNRPTLIVLKISHQRKAILSRLQCRRSKSTPYKYSVSLAPTVVYISRKEKWLVSYFKPHLSQFVFNPWTWKHTPVDTWGEGLLPKFPELCFSHRYCRPCILFVVPAPLHKNISPSQEGRWFTNQNENDFVTLGIFCKIQPSCWVIDAQMVWYQSNIHQLQLLGKALRLQA